MEKQPFTEAGFVTLQQWLYLLSNAELQQQALDIKTDVKAWAAAHFALNEVQLNYLNHINQQTIEFLSDQTSFAVGNRLPVILKKVGTAGRSANGDQGKLFETNSNLTASSDSSGALTAGGELIIEIDYQNQP